MQEAASCSGGREIKSSAVVKYSAAPPPTSYALLQEKTDLKLPPANWLRENPQLGSAGTTILGSNSKSKPFSRCDIKRNNWNTKLLLCENNNLIIYVLFAALAWPMTSLIVLGTMLTWSQTRRFVLLRKDLNFFFLA